MGYPVLVEQPLASTSWRLLGRRRERAELPVLPPGACYVFRVQGRYRQYEDEHLDLSDTRIVDATAVSVVQLRAQLVSTDVAIPSASAADDFTVRVTFHCKVVRPETVAESGLTDLDRILADHLRQDRDLSELGVRHSIDDVNEVRRRVDAQVTAYCTLVSPDVAGIEIEMTTVTVLTPEDLRVQGRRIRDEVWEQAVKRLQGNYENEDVRRLVDILSGGAVYADAFGISRNQIHLSEVSERSHAAEEARRKQLGEAVQAMINRGFFDRVAIDPVKLMDALTGDTTSLGATNALLPGSSSASSRESRSLEDRAADARPDFIPDEEDVD